MNTAQPQTNRYSGRRIRPCRPINDADPSMKVPRRRLPDRIGRYGYNEPRDT